MKQLESDALGELDMFCQLRPLCFFDLVRWDGIYKQCDAGPRSVNDQQAIITQEFTGVRFQSNNKRVQKEKSEIHGSSGDLFNKTQRIRR